MAKDDNKKQNLHEGWAFYAASQEALKDMANVPFLETLGTPMGNTPDIVPGIAVAYYYPTVCSDPNDGLNVGSGTSYKTRAAQAYFQYVTQGFTGGVDFEAPDLLMTAVAGSSLNALLEEGRKAYGITKYYLQQNNTYAKQIIEGLGFDYDALVKDLANFRSEFNIRVDQFNKTVAVPKDFMILKRWEFISKYLFVDTSDPEWSTTYAYAAEAVLLYNPTKLTTGTCLTFVTKGASSGKQVKLSPTDYFALVDKLMNALQDDDVRAMFGALRRVYNPADLHTLEYLSEDYTTTVVRSDIVAMQFHNMNWIMGDGDDPSSAGNVMYGACPKGILTNSSDNTNDVAMFQQPNGAIYNYIISGDDQSFKGNMTEYLLDLYDHMAEPGFILDATATIMVNTGQTYAGGSTAGNKIVARTEAYHYLRLQVGNDIVYVGHDIVDNGAGQVKIDQIMNLSKWDSHPILYVLTKGADNTLSFRGYLGEIDKYTFISKSNLTKMHQKSAYQLLNMPANSKSVTK